jgi:ribonuclease D
MFRNPLTPGEYRGTMTYSLIADESALQDVSSRLQSPPRIALDCEAAGFHRYTDTLCLVQLSTPEETVLFDPMAVNPAPVLGPLLEDPAVEVVMHGADFDVRLLDRDLGISLRGLFDTQIAATFLGASAIGLASLLEEHLEVKVSKKYQRADWAQRPLPSGLLDYAAGDTRHLLSLADILGQGLRDEGRDQWATEEFQALESIKWVEDESDPIIRFKGARKMEPLEVTILRAALAWRDRIAKARDRAPFRVVGDSVLVDVVNECPTSIDELSSLKGMSPRLAENDGEKLLREIREIKTLPETELKGYPKGVRNGPGRPTPEEEALMDSIRTLRTKKAEEIGLDKGILLSNAKINEIVRSIPPSVDSLRALPGIRNWQVEILGEEILGILQA